MDPTTIPLEVSSSPALTRSWRYDVFLSFRGEDTSKNFTDHLYSTLVQKGIKTFIDDPIVRRRENISLKILKALEESRISVIILSENYASSTWCLDELVQILQCKESRHQKVLPIFYKVSPSELITQRGRLGEAFSNHERRFKDNEEKVMRWRTALRQVANIKGWLFWNEYESTFIIHKIVEAILAQVFNDHTYVNVEYPIGLDSRVRDINNLLRFGENESDVQIVGVWGYGGIGKTTVAKAVHNSIAQKFEGSCFVANVGEISKAPGGLVQLQKLVLSEILKEKDLEVTNVDKGINMIKTRLSDKRVLLILDDVNQLDQLNNLAGGSDWFGRGSRIIIISRNKHLLMAHQVHDPIYEVKGLDHDEALQLFSWNAFPKRRLSSDYEELANKAVHYAQGLPLALILLGSHLCGRHLDEWRTVLSVLDNKKRVSNENILEDLKISYNSLEEWKTVLGVLDSYKRVPSLKIEDLMRRIPYHALEDPLIEELMQKPLVNIEETRIWMHDMTDEMGEEPRSYRMATSTAWIFLLTNIGIEISSAIFDQFSSPSKPYPALISMMLAIVAVIISIWELIHKGIKEKVKYRRQLGMFGWFYSRSDNRIFGSVADMCGLLGGISQWVYSTVRYVCTLRHVENPYKIYFWPIIFLLCLGASRLHWNQRNMTTKLKQ